MLCSADKQPRLLISPSEVKFDKKIITSSDKTLPDTKEIIVTNLGQTSLPWYIDVSKLQEDNVFSITPNKGIL